MRFEAVNGIFKTIGSGGNYINTCQRLAFFWMLRTAFALEFGCKESWGVPEVAAELGVFSVSLENLSEMSDIRASIMRKCLRMVVPPLAGSSEVEILRVGSLVHLGRKYSPGMWVFSALCGRIVC